MSGITSKGQMILRLARRYTPTIYPNNARSGFEALSLYCKHGLSISLNRITDYIINVAERKIMS